MYHYRTIDTADYIVPIELLAAINRLAICGYTVEHIIPWTDGQSIILMGYEGLPAAPDGDWSDVVNHLPGDLIEYILHDDDEVA